MANTKKKTEDTVVENNATPEEIAENKDTKVSEIELLKKQLEDMKAQMLTMTQSNSYKQEDTNGNRMIKFVNLTNGTVVLKGAGNATKEITGFLATRSFTEREAQIIVANMPNLVHSGYVYIADSKFVRDNDLVDSYSNFLNVEQMKKLFSRDPQYIIEAYKSTSEAQQRIIIDIIAEKRMKGEPVDANVLVEIGNLSGKKLVDIEPEE